MQAELRMTLNWIAQWTRSGARILCDGFCWFLYEYIEKSTWPRSHYCIFVYLEEIRDHKPLPRRRCHLANTRQCLFTSDLAMVTNPAWMTAWCYSKPRRF